VTNVQTVYLEHNPLQGNATYTAAILGLVSSLTQLDATVITRPRP